MCFAWKCQGHYRRLLGSVLAVKERAPITGGKLLNVTSVLSLLLPIDTEIDVYEYRVPFSL